MYLLHNICCLIDNVEKKCDTTTFSQHNLKVSSGLPTCVTDIIANDRPEIVDETLKLKWRLINLQKNKKITLMKYNRFRYSLCLSTIC